MNQCFKSLHSQLNDIIPNSVNKAIINQWINQVTENISWFKWTAHKCKNQEKLGECQNFSVNNNLSIGSSHNCYFMTSEDLKYYTSYMKHFYGAFMENDIPSPHTLLLNRKEWLGNSSKQHEFEYLTDFSENTFSKFSRKHCHSGN